MTAPSIPAWSCPGLDQPHLVQALLRCPLDSSAVSWRLLSLIRAGSNHHTLRSRPVPPHYTPKYESLNNPSAAGAAKMTWNKDPLQKPKPKTARGKRFLDDRESKIVEDVKGSIFMRGTKTSSVVNEALSDLYSLKKPDAFMMFKKNAVHPFEGGESEATLEFFSQRNDAAFVMLATHSKKRPDNLVLTRMFDHHVLDMIELGIADFQSIKSIAGPTCAVGMKPAFVFNGELFEQRDEYKMLQSMLLDFFRGHVVDSVNLAGIESVISVTATADKVLFRVYRIFLKKSGTKVPLIELQLMGPSIDWVIGRTRFASPELMKQALRQPKEAKPKKEKNVNTTALGETLGRVHVGQQKIDTIQVRKVKALKKSRVEKAQEQRNEE
ncbi:Ribosome production factor 2 [Paramicrosporidium saccamoebae]|uniref:Ribosome production factor 2 homolog n=1 Tax=Paramicrosporidium saccamoebae TaxID=1246581 RepID=A0A2H9TKH2_9FUNG|nr:Ribosome production factor 2 [Paramicrosporidium saccamoebae]